MKFAVKFTTLEWTIHLLSSILLLNHASDRVLLRKRRKYFFTKVFFKFFYKDLCFNLFIYILIYLVLVCIYHLSIWMFQVLNCKSSILSYFRLYMLYKHQQLTWMKTGQEWMYGLSSGNWALIVNLKNKAHNYSH